MNRRKFLFTTAGLAGAFAASHGILAAPARKSPLTPQEFQTKIVGPVLSVPTCYRKDLSLDMQGMQRIVELGISSGCGIVTLTAGNNQYDLLSYEEIKNLTQEIIDAVDGRAVMIAATGKWETDQAVDYAKFASDRGADALQVTLPAMNDDRMIQHFAAITSATPVGIVLHGDPPMPLLSRLLEMESVVAFKEEYTTIYSLQIYRAFGKQITLFAGGEKARLLTYYPYGMRAWYSTFMTFAPMRTLWARIALDTPDQELDPQLKLIAVANQFRGVHPFDRGRQSGHRCREFRHAFDS
jgi:dihydrodipicolinate synthase/N-acetylneuraminate lyase